jgi:hypothetical protein
MSTFGMMTYVTISAKDIVMYNVKDNQFDLLFTLT